MEENLSSIFLIIISFFFLKRKICCSYKFYLFLIYLRMLSFSYINISFRMIKHSEKDSYEIVWTVNDIVYTKDYILHKFRLGHNVTDVAKHTYSVYTWQRYSDSLYLLSRVCRVSRWRFQALKRTFNVFMHTGNRVKMGKNLEI